MRAGLVDVAGALAVSLGLTACLAVGQAHADTPAADTLATDSWEVGEAQQTDEVAAFLEAHYAATQYLRAHFLSVWGPALDCIADVESSMAGGYTAQNRRSSASGRYQMVARTGDYAVRLAGHPEYAGTPARTWPDWAQDAAAVALIEQQGGVLPAWRSSRHCDRLVP